MARPRGVKKTSLAVTRVVTRLMEWAARAPEGTKDLMPQVLVRMIREQIGMTQVQLARRCGMSQSNVADIERGKVDVQVGTLQKIFQALSCRLIMAPQPMQDLEALVSARARKAAIKRVGRVAGTMAMEQQKPTDTALEDLIQVEQEKLMQRRSSEIWDTE